MKLGTIVPDVRSCFQPRWTVHTSRIRASPVVPEPISSSRDCLGKQKESRDSHSSQADTSRAVLESRGRALTPFDVCCLLFPLPLASSDQINSVASAYILYGSCIIYLIWISRLGDWNDLVTSILSLSLSGLKEAFIVSSLRRQYRIACSQTVVATRNTENQQTKRKHRRSDAASRKCRMLLTLANSSACRILTAFFVRLDGADGRQAELLVCADRRQAVFHDVCTGSTSYVQTCAMPAHENPPRWQ